MEVYDFLQKTRYIQHLIKSIKNTKLSDYEFIWNPDCKHEKESLSEKFHMFRIENLENKEDSLRIVLPIEIDNIVLAYLVVWENQREK